MSSSPPPSRTPDRAPFAAASNPNIRRSFTLPARPAHRSQSESRSSASNGADGIETLFTSGTCKIVSFTSAAASSTRPPSASFRGDAASINTEPIPWGSATERTLAVGALRIYRVTSSNVSFLNSGNLLHTIFPKSQCWCVDGESKFVLRIRMDSYYRIEIPFETIGDREKVEEFKSVLSQVLQYERTPCPFRKGFEVELPERPKTPPRRQLKRTPEKAKKWLFDKTWVPEHGPRPSTPILENTDSGASSSVEEDDRSSVNTEPIETIPESPEPTVHVARPRPKPLPSAPSVRERAMTLEGIRSTTLPSGLVNLSSPGSVQSDSRSPMRSAVGDQFNQQKTERKEFTEVSSLMSSQESFHSLETSDQGTPPFVDAEAELLNPWAAEPASTDVDSEQRGRGRHRRQISEVTLRAQSSEPSLPSSPRTPTMNVHPGSSPTVGIHLSSPPSTPPLISDSDEDSMEPTLLDVPTPPDTIRMRRLTGATQRRAFSPMPHPQNLFRPTAPAPAKALTAALVRKTYELILGPPAHLVSLMLRIAAKISSFGFNTYSIRDDSQKIPCSWESSDEGEWEEDDFGIPLSNLESSSLRRRHFSGELD